MPRPCTLCRHPEREAIDAALVGGTETYRHMAVRFGTSPSALSRHRAHVATHLAPPSDAEEIVSAARLLRQLDDLTRHGLALVGQARDAGDVREAARALARTERALARLVRLRLEVQRYVTLEEARGLYRDLLRLGFRLLREPDDWTEFQDALRAAFDHHFRSFTQRRDDRALEDAQRQLRREARAAREADPAT